MTDLSYKNIFVSLAARFFEDTILKQSSLDEEDEA
jgi:hypothetical protein